MYDATPDPDRAAELLADGIMLYLPATRSHEPDTQMKYVGIFLTDKVIARLHECHQTCLRIDQKYSVIDFAPASVQPDSDDPQGIALKQRTWEMKLDSESFRLEGLAPSSADDVDYHSFHVSTQEIEYALERIEALPRGTMSPFGPREDEEGEAPEYPKFRVYGNALVYGDTHEHRYELLKLLNAHEPALVAEEHARMMRVRLSAADDQAVVSADNAPRRFQP